MPLHSQPIIIIIFINTDVYSPNLPSYSTVVLSSFPSIPPSLHTDRYRYRVKKKKKSMYYSTNQQPNSTPAVLQIFPYTAILCYPWGSN